MRLEWTPSLERRLLIILLITFAVVASIYSVTTPLFEMSDELWHYPMVKTLADGNGLPVQDGQNPGPWKQEGSQPPLYYYLAAAITAWIDTSDVNEVLRPNPHVDNGVITPDGNNNLVVHNYVRENSAWYGTVLAVHIGRLLSVIFGVGAVYFTYRIGIEVFPSQSWIALAGSAAVAFTPMFAFISGAVNNDSMSVMLASAALWVMIQIAQRSASYPTLRWSIILGTVLGVAGLTKTSTLGLFGLAGLTMAYAAWRAKRWQTFFIEGPIIIGIAASIAGWWYLRNYELYGDPLGLSAMIEVLGRRARPASLMQLWGERFGFMQSYWGLFGGVNIPMPDLAYKVLNTLAVISVFGLPVILARRIQKDRFDLHKWMPALLSLLWVAGVVVPLTLSWARITWSSQGRLVFAAIGCISLWFIASLSAWLPKRIGPLVASIIVATMGFLTVASPFLWILPRYSIRTEEVDPSDSIGIAEFTAPDSTQPVLRLVDYELLTDEAHPGDTVQIRLTWESLAPADRNWSVFVHLEDSSQLLAGQRDLYPGQGLIATTDMSSGERWSDLIVIPIASSAYAPEQLRVKIGLYDYESCPMPCERMLANRELDNIELGTIDLIPIESELPNPVDFNFSGELKLTGYEMSPRALRAGESISVTLFWQGLREMSTNYSVSVQILDAQGSNYGQKDSWPVNGAMPTSTWVPGEAITDPYVLALNENTPPGVYNVQIVVYSALEDGSFNRLQLVLPDGRLTDDFVLLTKLRVLP